MRYRLLLLIILFVLFPGLVPAEKRSEKNQALPPGLEAVQKYIMEEDYPELFAGRPYRVRFRDVVIADLDGDKSNEVIALLDPHYRQSPTMIIYQVSKRGEGHPDQGRACARPPGTD